MARMKLEAHCVTSPNLDWWARATLWLTFVFHAKQLLSTNHRDSSYAPNDPLMSVLYLLMQLKLRCRAALSFEYGPHSISGTRNQVLITLWKLELNNSKFVTNKAAGRHRRLCLRKIPDIDVCVLLILRLARGSCTVAFLGNCDTEHLKYVSVQLLLFRPQSPRH